MLHDTRYIVVQVDDREEMIVFGKRFTHEEFWSGLPNVEIVAAGYVNVSKYGVVCSGGDVGNLPGYRSPEDTELAKELFDFDKGKPSWKP